MNTSIIKTDLKLLKKKVQRKVKVIEDDVNDNEGSNDLKSSSQALVTNAMSNINLSSSSNFPNIKMEIEASSNNIITKTNVLTRINNTHLDHIKQNKNLLLDDFKNQFEISKPTTLINKSKNITPTYNNIIKDIKSNDETINENCNKIIWKCNDCAGECIPVRRESRCLCGHRLKEHNNDSFKCETKGCLCKKFFFIVAEGAWILRCRCKHKHIDHDCSKPPFECKKCSKESNIKESKSCQGFNSPWICNCGHGFNQHIQIITCQPVGSQLQDVYQENTKDGARRTFSVRQDGDLAKELEEDARKK